MFGRANPRKLKDQAQAAVTKGKYKKALESYLELEKLEPGNGDWCRRSGEMHRALGHSSEAIAAWTRAVDRYAEAGFLVKAVALCQMILRLDPEHTDAQRRLVSLNAARGIHVGNDDIDTIEPPPAEVRRAASEPPSVPVERASSSARPPVPAPAMPAPPPVPAPAPRRARQTLPPGAALEDISLHDAVPGAIELPEHDSIDQSGKIYEIPITLDEDLEALMVEEPDATGALERTPLFSDLPPSALHLLISKVELVELAQGDVLFRQGDEGRELYVIAEGEVAVIDEGPPRVHLTTLGEGAFFGEVALATSQRRTATIEATEPSQLLRLSREAVSELIDQEPSVLTIMLKFLRDRLLENLVRSNPLFAPFGEGERESLASKFRFLEVEPDTILVMQGHRAKGMYILLAGAAEVVRHDDGGARRLATLGSGDLAGEMSLLANTEAIATVKTTAKTLALELPAPVFREVIMTHPQVLMYVSDVAEQRRKMFEQIIQGDADFESGRIELV